jgi:hypothetical protein
MHDWRNGPWIALCGAEVYPGGMLPAWTPSFHALVHQMRLDWHVDRKGTLLQRIMTLLITNQVRNMRCMIQRSIICVLRRACPQAPRLATHWGGQWPGIIARSELHGPQPELCCQVESNESSASKKQNCVLMLNQYTHLNARGRVLHVS